MAFDEFKSFSNTVKLLVYVYSIRNIYIYIFVSEVNMIFCLVMFHCLFISCSWEKGKNEQLDKRSETKAFLKSMK